MPRLHPSKGLPLISFVRFDALSGTARGALLYPVTAWQMIRCTKNYTGETHRQSRRVNLCPLGNVVEFDGSRIRGHGQEAAAKRQQGGSSLCLRERQGTFETPLCVCATKHCRCAKEYQQYSSRTYDAPLYSGRGRVGTMCEGRTSNMPRQATISQRQLHAKGVHSTFSAARAYNGRRDRPHDCLVASASAKPTQYERTVAEYRYLLEEDPRYGTPVEFGTTTCSRRIRRRDSAFVHLE